MKICAKKCNECLYSKNRIVSAERAADIMMEVARKDSYFVCHKSSIRGEEEWVCAGSHPGQLVRIMGRLGALEYVDPETGETVEKPTGDK